MTNRRSIDQNNKKKTRDSYFNVRLVSLAKAQYLLLLAKCDIYRLQTFNYYLFYMAVMIRVKMVFCAADLYLPSFVYFL